MATPPREGHRTLPFPAMRRWALDANYMAHRRHSVHGLLEVDVTAARRAIREHRLRTGEQLSFTAYCIACLAQSIALHPDVHAYRDWRGRLVIFDDVNVNTMIEVEVDTGKAPMPHIIRAANRKTFRQIHDEIRAAQRAPASTHELGFMRWFLRLPAFVRRAFYSIAMGFPHVMRAYTSPVLVTSVGMFGHGSAWGIPAAAFALVVTLGTIAEKPGVAEGRIEIREYLCVTVSVDHDVVDGAPAARFMDEFRARLESGCGLAE